MEGYSTMLSKTKQILVESKKILSLHQSLMEITGAFGTWLNELKQSVLSSSDFSGDRYALMARLEWLNVS